MVFIIRRASTALAIATIAMVACIAASSMQAQILGCTSHQAINNTGCDLKLALYDAGGNVWSYFVPAGGPTVLNQPGTDFIDAIGIVSANDINHPFAGLPAPGCTPCVTMQAAMGTCCATVCYDAATCTFRINPCGPPCLP